MLTNFITALEAVIFNRKSTIHHQPLSNSPIGHRSSARESSGSSDTKLASKVVVRTPQDRNRRAVVVAAVARHRPLVA